MRKLIRADLLIIDDFALSAMDPSRDGGRVRVVIEGDSYRRRQKPAKAEPDLSPVRRPKS